MTLGELLISETTLQKIKDYHQFLCTNGVDEAGEYFKKQLQLNPIPLNEMDTGTFAQLLIQSKIPQIFAESDVYHDKRDWTLQEESILGDISVHMPVSFFNDGGHNQYINHNNPISANLAYVPGALLRSDLSRTTSDLKEIIVNGLFNQQRLNALYERRLLPQLLQINSQAQHEGKKAAITLPGIGTGLFAGRYGIVIKAAFREALEYVLIIHQDKLAHIDIVHYDPYNGDVPQSKKIGHIDYRVCPSSSKATTGQLQYPEGSTASTHTLTSFVAWDHFSWPGNDFWPGSRATDDGVKAASTDTMAVITGEQGVYNSQKGSYEPQGFSSWKDLAEAKKLNFTGAIYVVSNDGKKTPLVPIEQQITNKSTHEEQIQMETESVSAASHHPFYDLGEGNQVTGIEQKDGMYIVHGQNTAGQYRSIQVHADGSIKGYDGAIPNGHVSICMTQCINDIFKHFNVTFPQSNSNAAVVHLSSNIESESQSVDVVGGPIVSPLPEGEAKATGTLPEPDIESKNVPLSDPKPDYQGKSYEKLSEEIDGVLNEFSATIDKIGANFPAAKAIARKLLDGLTTAKKETFSNPDLHQINLLRLQVVFEFDINWAIPKLQRDLGWGDYLSNLAKTILNFITTVTAQVFTFGHATHQGFFTLKKSEARINAEELDKNFDTIFKL